MTVYVNRFVNGVADSTARSHAQVRFCLSNVYFHSMHYPRDKCKVRVLLQYTYTYLCILRYVLYTYVHISICYVQGGGKDTRLRSLAQRYLKRVGRIDRIIKFHITIKRLQILKSKG